jgi:hypothetical protein
LSSRTVGDFTEAQVQQILTLYDQGWTMQDLFRRFGTTWPLIRKTLVAHGRKIRSAGESQQLLNELDRGLPIPTGGNGSDENESDLSLAPDVAKQAQQIRDGWSEEQREGRATGIDVVPWTVPVTKDLRLSRRPSSHG